MELANLQWDDLRYFLAVAETHTLAGAARRLGVNHSTVFRRINRFEETVGTRLFERLPDGYQRTVAGEELYAHAAAIGEEIDRLTLRVLGKDYRPSGVVRITAAENLATTYLPKYLQRFRRRFPDITFELDVGAASRDLTRREADLAVRATTSPPPHLIGRRAVTLKWGCYASRAYLRRRGTPGQAGELRGHDVLGADGSLRQLPPFRALDRDPAFAPPLRCSTLNAMSAMAEAGHGIALLPDDQQKPSLVRLFDVDPGYASEIWLLTHPELRRTERIRLLLEHLHDEFRRDPRLRRGG